MLKDSLSVGKLLSHETISGGTHGKTSVLELLGLHLEELSRVGGLQANLGFVVDIVLGVKKTGLEDGDIFGIDPAYMVACLCLAAPMAMVRATKNSTGTWSNKWVMAGPVLILSVEKE
jgi:hypothetical protein